MIEKAEGEYTELLRKRKVVENDKKKIKSEVWQFDGTRNPRKMDFCTPTMPA